MSQHRFFQLHLSTAVVLMLVAGVLVWANVRKREVVSIYSIGDRAESRDHGWPFECYSEGVHYLNSLAPPRKIYFREISIKHTVSNALTALAILLSVWQLCEWRIRRRTREAEDGNSNT